jgi:hypothetical protein
VRDIDTAVVDSLKVLDPKRPIREADIEQPLLTVPWLLPVACTNRPTFVPIRPRVGARKTHTAASGRMSEQLRRLRNIIFS